MQLMTEQVLAAPADTVARLLSTDAWYEAVAATTSDWRPTLLDVDDRTGRRRVRYEYRGRLHPAAAAVIDPDDLGWVEVSDLHHGHRLGDTTVRELRTVHFDPDHADDRLEATGTLALIDEGSRTVRRLQLGLKVRVPLVHGKVERAIAAGLREHAEIEATAVRPLLVAARGAQEATSSGEAHRDGDPG